MVLVRRRELTETPRPINQTRSRPAFGWWQSIVTVTFTGAAAYVVLAGWPHDAAAAAAPASAGFIVASALLLLATPWLLAERYLAALTTERLPERDDLRTLTLLPVCLLAAQAALQVCQTLGFGILRWPQLILCSVLLLICVELSLRVLATWFLPPRDSRTARASITSALAGLITGRSLSPAAVAGIVRSQFGMDFSRSWALAFMRASAIPVTLLMFGVCWFLTGVTRIDLDERGSYERFGDPAVMLQPGLHVVLPWPFGLVRHVELGVVHTVRIRFGGNGAAPDSMDRSTAEGDAPASANRLWDSDQASDVTYIIASSERDQQSFQTVSANVSVLYRIGLSDAAARAALYRAADPDALVQSLASRVLAKFFASRTLPSVLGESQAVIASDLRTRLRTALDNQGSGIDVVAINIEAIHPPSGAASAYRNVQAAEIEATTSIATERGRARTTDSVAHLNAHNAVNEASAEAAETVGSATADLTGITTDDRPYRTAGRPFLLERYFTDIRTALANVPLVIVDHRLGDASLPTIDLRLPGAPRDASDGRPAPAEKAQ